MGLFKKLSSMLGTEAKSNEPSALDKIREMKRQMGIVSDDDDKDYEEELEEDEDLDDEELEEDEDLDEVEEDEEEDDEEEDEDDEEEEEDEDLVENRAKPVFIINLKRFEVPMTPSEIFKHMDELSSYGEGCILMRDKDDSPNEAECFYGEPIVKLMDKAIACLWSWNENEDTPIVPVVDILTDVKSYNCNIDDDIRKMVAYYAVTEYGEVWKSIADKFPFEDSLIRIITDIDGAKYIKDFCAYSAYQAIDEDDEGWVSRMIDEHNIEQ